MKSILERGSEFLSSLKPQVKIGAVLVLGLVLILLSGIDNEKVAEPEGEEARAAEMCSLIEGVGECRVMMTYKDSDEREVYAVLVICEGGESAEVREKITSMFCALYGIGAHRVEIERLSP